MQRADNHTVIIQCTKCIFFVFVGEVYNVLCVYCVQTMYSYVVRGNKVLIYPA